MKKMKHLLALLLALVMILSTSGVQVLADNLPDESNTQENVVTTDANGVSIDESKQQTDVNDLSIGESTQQTDPDVPEPGEDGSQEDTNDVPDGEAPALLDASNDNTSTTEGTVQVTIDLNAVTTAMTLAGAEDSTPVDIGEPTKPETWSPNRYTFQATPGNYIITGYGTDGTTVNGTMGLTVTDSATQSYTLDTITTYARNEGWTYGEDYTMELRTIRNRSSYTMGDSVEEGRKTILLYRYDYYELDKIPAEKHAAEYNTTTIKKSVFATSEESAPLELVKWLNITLPSEEYKLEVGTLTKYYVYTAIEPVETIPANGDGAVTVRYKPQNGTYYYRVRHENDAAYWNWINFSKSTDITIEPSMLTSVEVKKGGDTIEVDAGTINRNLEYNQYETGDLLLNVNTQNYVKLDQDETFQMVPMRSWQAIENFINGQTAVPDFHYQIVDLDGKPSNGVVSVDDTGLITAEGKGTAIILITYDAMTNMACYNTGIGAGSGGGFTFFSAIWPENTGAVVVSVGGEKESGIQLGMTINEGQNTKPDQYDIVPKLSGDGFDGDLDFIYFTGNEGGTYAFHPTEGVNVTVARPTIGERSASYSGFTSEGVTAADGTVTLTGLPVGTNIVRLEKDGKQEFQIIRVKKMDYKLLKADGTEYSKDEQPQPGDTVTVQFGQVFRPANKLAGIYNMNASLRYMVNGGYVKTGGGQYNFAYQTQKISFKIPEDYKDTSIALTDGTINVTGFGSPYGAHRTVTYDGVNQNFTATIRNGLLGSLPDIVIPVQSAEVRASFAKDQYKAGDLVTMQVALHRGQKVNALGYSLQYDNSLMTYLSASASEGFTSFRTDADKNTGGLMRAVYVPEGKDITPDENGMVFDTVTFMMTADGTPSAEFVTVEDDVDFSDRSVCVMSAGKHIYAFGEVAYDSSVVADMEAAKAVDDLIAAIETVTLDSADAIKAARSGYNDLTDTQKQYVEKLEDLEMAEARYDLWSKGDVNFDGRINMPDMSQMLTAYGTEEAQCDITVDGIVNANDVSVLLTNYGTRL